MTPETDERVKNDPEEAVFKWSISPKTQVIVVAVAIGLFNCLVVAMFAAVFFLRAG